LKDARFKLADVLGFRIASLEPLRALITQSISITESEKAATKNHAVVEGEDDVPW
jgi:hypothetical protein